MKIAFLDRDGTIIKDYPDEEWKNVEKPEFFKNSIPFLKEIQKLGYKIIFISNQYLINQRIISQKQFLTVHELFLNELEKNNIKVLKFFYCPHSDEDNCNCKKPKTGMIGAAIREFPEIDLSKSFYVGDSLVDVELSEKFGLDMYHISDVKIRNNKKYFRVDKAMDVLSFL